MILKEKNKIGRLTLLDLKTYYKAPIIKTVWDFPGGAVVNNLPANEGDMGSSPDPGRCHMPQSN